MSAQPAADVEMLAAVERGDEDAIQRLVAQYGPVIERVAAGILKDRAEAEDLRQDLLWHIVRRAGSYEPARGPVRTWITWLAYCRSFGRLKGLRHKAAYRGEALTVIDARPVRGRLPLTPAECRWVLAAGWATLTPPQRRTLELVGVEGRTLRDVAADLSVSLGTARHYYYRGLAKMRQALTCRAVAGSAAGAGSRGRSGAPRG